MNTFPKVWDEARKNEVKKLKPGRRYAIITKDCEISSPFDVRGDLGNDVFDVWYEMDEGRSHYGGWPGPGQSMFGQDDSAMGKEFETRNHPTLQMNSKFQPYREIKYVDNRVIVPQEAVVVELTRNKDDGDYPCSIPHGPESALPTDENKTIALGSLADVQHALAEKFASFSITQHDSTYIVDGDAGRHTYPKKEAQVHLMLDHGLSKHAAGVMLKKAQSSGIHEFKLAYGSSAGVLKEASVLKALVGGNTSANANFDGLMEEDTVGLGGNRRLSIMENSVEETPVEDAELSGYSQFEQYDAWHNYEPGDFQDKVQTAHTAIEDGDKTLFDVSSLTSMLGSVKADRNIDDYLKNLFKGGDSLGRLLLNFYWHREDFEERYGKSEMPQGNRMSRSLLRPDFCVR